MVGVLVSIYFIYHQISRPVESELPLVSTAKGIEEFVDKDVEVIGIGSYQYDKEGKISYVIKFDDGSTLLSSSLPPITKVKDGLRIRARGIIQKCEPSIQCLGIAIETKLIQLELDPGFIDVSPPPTPEPPEEQPKECDDQCYLELARTNKDESFCEKIKDPTLSQQCYGGMAVLTQNEELCEKAGEYRDACLWAVAQETQTGQICEKIFLQSQKDQCFEALAHQFQDYSLCLSIKDGDSRGMCLRDIAVMLDDVSICEKIDKQYYQDWCYLDLATILRNLDLCEKIKESGTRDLCHQEVAKNL